MNAKIIKLLTKEPVRAWLYSLVIPLLAYLVTQGVVSGNVSNYVLAIVAAVLGVGGTETARGAVSPVQPAAESNPE